MKRGTGEGVSRNTYPTDQMEKHMRTCLSPALQPHAFTSVALNEPSPNISCTVASGARAKGAVRTHTRDVVVTATIQLNAIMKQCGVKA